MNAAFARSPRSDDSKARQRFPFSVMLPRHHVWDILLGPVATNRISMGSGKTIVRILLRADFGDGADYGPVRLRGRGRTLARSHASAPSDGSVLRDIPWNANPGRPESGFVVASRIS